MSARKSPVGSIASRVAEHVVDVLELAVHRREPDVGDLVQALQFVHQPVGREGLVMDAGFALVVAGDFDRGVAMLHSFWFSAAIETFNSVESLADGDDIVQAFWPNIDPRFSSTPTILNGTP